LSDAQIDITPEPTPDEAEAIRRALEALGLVEPSPPDRGQSPKVHVMLPVTDPADADTRPGISNSATQTPPGR
jgi:hypothetical protein